MLGTVPGSRKIKGKNKQCPSHHGANSSVYCTDEYIISDHGQVHQGEVIQGNESVYRGI